MRQATRRLLASAIGSGCLAAAAVLLMPVSAAADAQGLHPCKRALVYVPKGHDGYGLIISRLKVRRISCRRGLQIAGANSAGEPWPRGWQCTFVDAKGRNQCWRGRKLLTYYFEGSAS
jgi:hypothetical protein